MSDPDYRAMARDVYGLTEATYASNHLFRILKVNWRVGAVERSSLAN
jgi:hypothetical protein